MKKNKLIILSITLMICLQNHAQISEEWVSLYTYEEGTPERPNDMVVDEQGNIYICGWTSLAGNFDFIAIKYNPLGELLWSTGILDGINEAQAICLDDAGNVYITARSNQNLGDFVALKFNTDGVLLWTQHYDNNSVDGGYDIGIGANGMVYAVGYSDSDIITMQYNPEGELQWTATFNGPEGALDIGKSLVLDQSSNVYITGYSTNVEGVGSNRDITTIKYNSEGVEQWVNLYDGGGNTADEGYEIALDEQDNVYVLGYSNDESYHSQWTTIKYTSDGNEEWVNKHYNPETLGGSPKAIAVHDSQNIYVTGSIGLGITTAKINNTGDTIWTRNYNDIHADQCGSDIITDDDGNVYLTGWVRDEVGMWTRDYGTLKYSPSGALLWDIWYAGYGEDRDDALKICLDHENNVIITGETDSGPSSYDIGTIKYSQSTSVKELNQSIAFIIYPNPTHGKIQITNSNTQINSKSQNSISKLEVVDIYGKVAECFNPYPVTRNPQLDISHFPTGIYFIRISLENQIIVKKIIKM